MIYPMRSWIDSQKGGHDIDGIEHRPYLFLEFEDCFHQRAKPFTNFPYFLDIQLSYASRARKPSLSHLTRALGYSPIFSFHHADVCWIQTSFLSDLCFRDHVVQSAFLCGG